MGELLLGFWCEYTGSMNDNVLESVKMLHIHFTPINVSTLPMSIAKEIM